MSSTGEKGEAGVPGVTLVVATCMKNAEARAEAWAKNVLAIADEVWVLDTGSTDETISILERHGVHVVMSRKFDQYTAREDFEFDTARNEIARRVPEGAWIIAVDADEELVATGDWRKELGWNVPSDIDLLAMDVNMKDGSGRTMTTFKGERMYRNLPNIRWNNAMHNVLNVPPGRKGNCGSLMVNSLKGVDTPENRKERSKQRVAMAKKYFGKKIKKNPQDARSMFYLGQTYHDVLDYKQAIAWFNRYLKVTIFRDEAYEAGIYLTKCHIGMNNLDLAEKAMSSCLRFNPTRAEGFAYLGRIAYSQNRINDAIEWFLQATACTQPVTRFFQQMAVYEYDTWDRLSMAYHKVGKNTEARIAANRALDSKSLPATDRIRITKNLGYFVTPDSPEYYDKCWTDRPLPSENETKRVKRMVELLDGCTKVLDVGCGPGWPLRHLPSKVRYTGVDISQKARDLVEARGGKTKENIHDVYGKTHDGCILGEVLEHIEDDAGFLKDVCKKLKKGATLVVSVPMNGVMKDPAHVRDYTMDTLKDLLDTVCITETCEELWPWTIMTGKVK